MAGNSERPGSFILRQGLDDAPIGSVTKPGKSASIATNLTAETEFQIILQRAPKRNDILSGTFAGDIRAAGFDVVRAPTKLNPKHVRIVESMHTFEETGRNWLSIAFDKLFKVKKTKQ
ncbi:MAG: hypothetical protein GY816_15835 [Cytophagales bacterium]|nr:hypothetical protein [Cytophagales bacterium]